MLRRKVCYTGSNQPTSNAIAFPEAKPNTLTTTETREIERLIWYLLHLVFFLTSIGLSQSVQRISIRSVSLRVDLLPRPT